MSSNKISITELEFDTIKTNLKTYLSSQSQFQDYDFEGSGMSVLIDLLAYNTHYMGYYANMLGNEMFLDSAALRDSVVSHAKHLNVHPTSVRTSTAKLNFTFTPTGTPTYLTIAKNTKFNSSINGFNYKFVTNKTTSIARSNTGTYTATDIEVKEGKIMDKQYIVEVADTSQRFIIPNTDVDTSTVFVTVQASENDTTVYTYSDGNAVDITTIKSGDKVYFIHECEDGKYELTFGDGSIGEALTDGNIIFIEYIISAGAAANKASTFLASGQVAELSSENYILTTSQNATGGADIQTIDSIKFQAPKLFAAQGRATTKNDYKAILLNERPDIESITVYGGEDADPVEYGKVFIAIKPTGNTFFTNTVKEHIKSSVLKKSNVVTVTPEIVDPIFYYLQLDITVNYDPTVNLTDEATLKTNINTSVQSYFQTNLEKFDEKFRYSKIAQIVDNTNDSIIGSVTKVRYAQRIFPSILGSPETHTINFNNPILQGCFKSTQFVASDGFTYQLVDDTLGNVKVVRLSTGTYVGVDWVNDYSTGHIHRIEASNSLHTGKYHYETAHSTSSQLLEQMIMPDGSTNQGTIDYAEGKIILNNFTPHSITDGTSYLKLSVHPQVPMVDVTPLRQQILTYDVNDIESIVIHMVAETPV